MGQILQPLANLLKFHKLKILAVLLYAAIFALWLFPPGDLSDIVSDKVTHATGIYTQLDGLSLAFNPSPGVHADNLVVEPIDLPPIKASSADVFVSLLNAVMGRQAATATANDLFKGSVNVDFSDGEKLKAGERVKNVAIVTNKVDLNEVAEYLRSANLLQLAVRGALKLNSNLRVDPTFAEQPSGTVAMEISAFSLPSQMLQTVMGPMQTPPLEFGKFTVQAKMNEGQLELQEVNFGGAKDGLSGKIRGQIALFLRRDRAGVAPNLGNYKIGIDMTIPKAFLNANPTFNSAMGILDGMVGRFKKETTSDVKYSFAASGSPGAVPNFTDKL